MPYNSLRKNVGRAWRKFKRLFERQEPGWPEDPYAYVTAPKKPRLPHRSASAVVEEPEP
jgi:hypothetical protein